MENTTEDFWRMVYERDCAVIVMLSGLDEMEEVNIILESRVLIVFL